MLTVLLFAATFIVGFLLGCQYERRSRVQGMSLILSQHRVLVHQCCEDHWRQTHSHTQADTSIRRIRRRHSGETHGSMFFLVFIIADA